MNKNKSFIYKLSIVPLVLLLSSCTVQIESSNDSYTYTIAKEARANALQKARSLQTSIIAETVLGVSKSNNIEEDYYNLNFSSYLYLGSTIKVETSENLKEEDEDKLLADFKLICEHAGETLNESSLMTPDSLIAVGYQEKDIYNLLYLSVDYVVVMINFSDSSVSVVEE